VVDVDDCVDHKILLNDYWFGAGEFENSLGRRGAIELSAAEFGPGPTDGARSNLEKTGPKKDEFQDEFPGRAPCLQKLVAMEPNWGSLGKNFF
jgi:hypothetical protein